MPNALCQDSTTLFSSNPSLPPASLSSPLPTPTSESSWGSFAFSEAELRELRSALAEDLGRDLDWNDTEIREMAYTTLEFLHLLKRLTSNQREEREQEPPWRSSNLLLH